MKEIVIISPKNESQRTDSQWEVYKPQTLFSVYVVIFYSLLNVEQGLANMAGKDQRVRISGFKGRLVFATTTQLWYRSLKAATGNT